MLFKQTGRRMAGIRPGATIATAGSRVIRWPSVSKTGAGSSRRSKRCCARLRGEDLDLQFPNASLGLPGQKITID